MGEIISSESDNNRKIGLGGILSSSAKTPNEIRKESFLSWIKNMFCPNFKYSSIIFILVCLNLIIYVITILFGIKLTPNELLAPKFETLDLFGMKNPPKIYKGQIYRLISFGFLHANLVHLTTNLISLIIIGSIMEGLIGNINAGLLYLLSNICGGMFSCVMDINPGVGASVAVFGILGGYLGFAIINWDYIKRNNKSFFINLIFIIFIVLMNAAYGINNPTIDNNGHFGGLIYGFFFIFILVKPKDQNYNSLWLNYEDWRKYSIIFISISSFLLVFKFWII